MTDDSCAKCAQPIASCRCVCRYPNGGCGQRITFRVNDNMNRQPFDLDGTAHHATCRAYIQEKDAAITCPSCGWRRRRDQACGRCGWSPSGRRPVFTVPTLERFGGNGP